jgi:predicted nucleotidyltransferase
MTELTLDQLQEGRQKNHVMRVAPVLWGYCEVAAIWVVGSLARGQTDFYSDVDLWIAVSPEALSAWRAPDFEKIFSGTSVGHRLLPIPDGTFVHSMLLSDGSFFDLAIQSTDQEPSREQRRVLGCRNTTFAQKLGSNFRGQPSPENASADSVKTLLSLFWINTLKHEKVLFRKLDLLSVVGLSQERMMLMQLWYILETGYDPGYVMGVTLHGLADQARAIERSRPEKTKALLIGPTLTDRESIIRAIEALREEVSQSGRVLSARYGFEYPEVLEATAKSSWRRFKESYVA